MKLGIKMNLTYLLNYERCENKIIYFPSFNYTTPLIENLYNFQFLI